MVLGSTYCTPYYLKPLQYSLHGSCCLGPLLCRKRQHYARLGHVSFDEWSQKVATFRGGSFVRVEVEGSAFIYRPVGCKLPWGEGWRIDGKEEDG